MASNSSWDPVHLPSQAGETIVVTGGNAGIGYFVSEQLAGAGARVIMASRSRDKADTAAASIRERIPGAQVEFVKLDLSSLGSIREAAESIRKLGPVDVLINNAGATSGSSKRVLTEDGLEFVVGSNAFGPYALTALVFPALPPTARIISLGSMATRIVKLDPSNLQSTSGRYNFFRAYAYSKHAMHAFALELQRKLAASGSPIESLLAHPGSAVDLLSSRRPGINDRFTPLDYLSAIISQGKDRGAWPVVRAATDPLARGGEFYGPRRSVSGAPVLLEPVASSASEEFGEEFWRQAEAATGVRFEPGS
ncbi:MAG TPA: SDR family NAD(P)-dependent oxidoreductase [Galbitalea sp.]|jgi:NAD(P)-dependent dehydrogenase (short-subunit alcohol dehydrogenase family)|nr:SDR family NAD(P)-dependent oxidoreductase [Galbitalea sp.]